jgi:hypothetical protein
VDNQCCTKSHINDWEEDAVVLRGMDSDDIMIWIILQLASKVCYRAKLRCENNVTTGHFGERVLSGK